MHGLTINLLGGFEVIDPSGRPIVLRRKKPKAVLAYLALQLDRPISRDAVVGMFWGESEERRARQSLRQLLYILKRTLPDEGRGTLRLQGGEILLTSACANVDAVTFRSLIATGRPLSLEKAAAMYRGPLLGDFTTGESAFDSWLDAERSDIHRIAVSALRGILHTRISSGQTEVGENIAVRLLSLDATQEDIHRQLIKIYLAQNRRDQALRQYEQCRDVLRKELALSPDRKTEALVATIRANSFPVRQPDRPPRPTPAVRPSLAIVAVRPFSEAPADRARGLTSEVTHLLSAWRHLAVIDRSTMLSHATGATKAGDLADELGATYVLEGEVRVQTNGIRVRIDLVDALTGYVLWTEAFAARSKDCEEEDTELAQRIVARATYEIDRAEGRRTRLTNSGRLGLWQYYQRGWALYHEFDAESHWQAQEMFKRALDLDPAFTPAMAALAIAYNDGFGRHHLGENSTPLSMEIARRAIELDDLDSMAHIALSKGALRSHDHRRAVEAGHEAVRLNPSNPAAHIASGRALALAGKPTLGLASLKKGLALTSPYDSDKFCRMHGISKAHLTARNHDAAVKWNGRAIHERPNWAYAHFVRASALAHLKRWSEAEVAIERCLKIDPGCVDFELNQSTEHLNPADHDHCLDGVRQLGFG